MESSVTELKGIGAKTERLLNRIGVYTVKDILLYFPRDYIRYKAPVPPGEVTAEGVYAVTARVAGMPLLKRAGGMELVQA